MKESNRLSDTQATVILTALAVLMLGAIWWGVTHPASDRQSSDSSDSESTESVAAVATPSAAVMKIVRILLEPTLTTSSIPPEAMVGPNERVELNTLNLDLTDFEFSDPQMPNISDFKWPAPELRFRTSNGEFEAFQAVPPSEDTTETEGK